MKSRTTITLSEELEERLAERGSCRSGVIERDLNRLYCLLEKSLIEIDLNIQEACSIVDALNGTAFDPWSIPLLWANIEDAIALEKLDNKWGIDGKALVEKLKSLTPFQCLAIIDAAERFWSEPYREADMEEAVRKVFNLR